MGLFSMIRDATAGYSPVESFLYDRFIVKAAAMLHDLSMSRVAPLVHPGMRLLDVGCGGGQFAVDLARRFPTITVTGLDLSPEQVARARRRAAPVADRVTIVPGTALDLPFPDGHFDLVYSLGSIKHWPDRARGLRECARVLAPSAPLVILEGDRGARHEDVVAFIDTWPLPPLIRPLFVAFYRTIVTGQSLDLDDARALLDSVPTVEGTIERPPGVPAWILSGQHRLGAEA
ncbi:MAG: class I SAM-dependent methyltransferase [Polyangiaceae bacterium]